MILTKIKNRINHFWVTQQEERFGRRIIEYSKFSFPDFMIIGAPKAGTTSLFQYLAQHPSIIAPVEKELNYFSMRNQIKGLKWYLSQFPLKKDKNVKLTFEATPAYLHNEKVPSQISNLTTDLKFIALLRDPVKRAYSHWNFYQEHSKVRKREFLDNRSFEVAITEELEYMEQKKFIRVAHQYLSKGLYAKHLNRWYSYFDKSQILLLDFQEFKETPNKSLEKVTSFLGIDNIYTSFNQTQEKFEGQHWKKDERNNNQLKAYNNTNYKQKLNEELENQLREFYLKPDKDLALLTGRKFSWMK